MSTSTEIERQPRKKTSPAGVFALPPEVQAVLGPPAVLKTEDLTAYNRLMEALAISVSPESLLEWIYVRDIVDCTWHTMRCKRAIAVEHRMARQAGILRILNASNHNELEQGLFEEEANNDTAQGILNGDRAATAMFKKTLDWMGLDAAAVEDAAYAAALEEVAPLENLIDRHLTRRDNLLREISRMRTSFPSRIRAGIEAVIDAEFHDK